MRLLPVIGTCSKTKRKTNVILETTVTILHAAILRKRLSACHPDLHRAAISRKDSLWSVDLLDKYSLGITTQQLFIVSMDVEIPQFFMGLIGQSFPLHDSMHVDLTD